MERRRQPVRDRPVARDVDADLLRIAGGDHLAQSQPLLFQVAALPGRLVERAVGVAVDRQEFHAAVVRPAVEEHEHRRPAGGEHGPRDQAEEHRILVVLPVDDEPQVDPGFAHQSRQELVQPLLEHAVEGLHPVPVRQHVARAVEYPSLIEVGVLCENGRCGQREQTERGGQPAWDGSIHVSSTSRRPETTAIRAVSSRLQRKPPSGSESSAASSGSWPPPISRRTISTPA